VKTVSRFLEPEPPARVQITFEGAPLMVPEGANLAAALLGAGVEVFRHSPASGAPRAPYCMMGACFECLVEIGGVARQACMIEVAPGLEVRRPALAGAAGGAGTVGGANAVGAAGDA